MMIEQIDSGGLALGFDDTCTRCSRTAQDIKAVVGDELLIVPLTSPAMQEWRKRYFGVDAPWVPTLVRPNGVNNGAWTGWSMAPVLLKQLGRRTTMRVIHIIGTRTLEQRQKPTRQTSRRGFMTGAAGVVAGLTLLLGTRSNRAAAEPITDRRVTEFTGKAELSGVAERHLLSRDMQELASNGSTSNIALAASKDAEVRDMVSEPVFTDTGYGFGPPSAPGTLQVSAAETDGFQSKEAGARSVAMFYDHDGGVAFLSIHEYIEDGVLATEARETTVSFVESGEEIFEDVRFSINGSEPTPIQEDQDAIALGYDPCGACNCGPAGSVIPEQVRDVCHTDSVLACIASIAGCVGCARCRSWQCVSCLLASCLTLVGNCCPEFRQFCSVCPFCA